MERRPCTVSGCIGDTAEYFLHRTAEQCGKGCKAPQDHHQYSPAPEPEPGQYMTIQNLIDTLEHELSLGWVSKDDTVYIATPSGLEVLTGVDPRYDAIPNEPRLALVVATE